MACRSSLMKGSLNKHTSCGGGHVTLLTAALSLSLRDSPSWLLQKPLRQSCRFYHSKWACYLSLLERHRYKISCWNATVEVPYESPLRPHGILQIAHFTVLFLRGKSRNVVCGYNSWSDGFLHSPSLSLFLPLFFHPHIANSSPPLFLHIPFLASFQSSTI